jgi:LMBR1 domain-containing protein 1
MKEVRLNFIEFSACAVGFLGWIMFVMFGGIGLIALPYDMILDYIYKPKIRKPVELATKKVILRERTKELITSAQEVKLKQDENQLTDGGWFSKFKGNRSYKKHFENLKKDVFELEQQVELFEMEE